MTPMPAAVTQRASKAAGSVPESTCQNSPGMSHAGRFHGRPALKGSLSSNISAAAGHSLGAVIVDVDEAFLKACCRGRAGEV